MQGVLYEEPTIWLFLLVTVVLGGAAAWQTGQAVAQTWRPFWKLVPYVLLLGWGVRFLHYALFEGTFLSLHFYAVDTVLLFAFAAAGWRLRRARQMATQYPFAYVRDGLFGWRKKTA
jgi:hypothetical protein